jgi:hypothetical protein
MDSERSPNDSRRRSEPTTTREVRCSSFFSHARFSFYSAVNARRDKRRRTSAAEAAEIFLRSVRSPAVIEDGNEMQRAFSLSRVNSVRFESKT